MPFFKSTAALTLFCIATLSQAATQPLETAEKWASCVAQADVTCLESLLTTNYRHTHGTALVETKEQFIGALANGSRKYSPIHFEDVQVLANGNTAVVLGKFNLKVISNGNTLEAVNRFGMVIVSSDSDEQILYFQATPVKAAATH